MELNAEYSKILSQLLMKVLTPIMVFILIIFFATGRYIFNIPTISTTFNVDIALWIWLITFLAFTPLAGAILWLESMKAIKGAPKKKRKRSTPAIQETNQNDVSV
ncbi:hypothetical protein [Paenibacillus xylanexedens]|uniref:hypothetical protein n=1 Tax=Paenibacillus xylanexedens TaxID=528191 RepID=UPI00119D1B15|nr:hypothetical protein [Paenibacillus xylanexedens]